MTMIESSCEAFSKRILGVLQPSQSCRVEKMLLYQAISAVLVAGMIQYATRSRRKAAYR